MVFNGDTTDRDTVNDTLSSPGYRIEQLRFADGSVLSYADLLARVLVSTPGNDTLYGDETANLLPGGTGDDSLSSRDGPVT